MKKHFLALGLLFLMHPLWGSEALKKAFAEGIKASVDVVKYERAQAEEDIPQGYCVAIVGKDKPLDIWQEVKLESLALFLKLEPSLLGSTSSDEKVLCMSVKKEKEEALKVLKQIEKHYPKLKEYITKVEILPSKMMHRIIPGVGVFATQNKKTKTEIDVTKKPDIPLSGRVVLLDSGKKSKVMFDNGSTKVVATALQNIYYIEHTIYRRKAQ